MHHEKQELSAILLQLSTLSLLSNSAPISDVCNSHSPIHPSERRNDLYKYVINNFLQKVTNYTKVFYRVYYIQKCHKNYLHLSFLSPVSSEPSGCLWTWRWRSVWMAHRLVSPGMLHWAPENPNGCTPKPQVGFEILGNLSPTSGKASKWEPWLIFGKPHSIGPVMMFLHLPGRGNTFLGSFSGQLVAGGVDWG